MVTWHGEGEKEPERGWEHLYRGPHRGPTTCRYVTFTGFTAHYFLILVKVCLYLISTLFAQRRCLRAWVNSYIQPLSSKNTPVILPTKYLFMHDKVSKLLQSWFLVDNAITDYSSYLPFCAGSDAALDERVNRMTSEELRRELEKMMVSKWLEY